MVVVIVLIHRRCGTTLAWLVMSFHCRIVLAPGQPCRLIAVIVVPCWHWPVMLACHRHVVVIVVAPQWHWPAVLSGHQYRGTVLW